MRVVSRDTCRPFSADRSGMILGEGASMLLLEEATAAEVERSDRFVRRFGLASDQRIVLYIGQVMRGRGLRQLFEAISLVDDAHLVVAGFGPDYRLAPLQARNETFTWKLPEKLPPGPVTVTATVWYSRIVASVAEFLEVPDEEVEADEGATAHEAVTRAVRAPPSCPMMPTASPGARRS